MAALRYTVLIYPDEYPDEGAYPVVVPVLPGCVTWGNSLDEAVASARDAIEGHVAALRDTGPDIPEEDGPPLVTTLEVDAPAPLEATARERPRWTSLISPIRFGGDRRPAAR
jgi:predicted RNase H-like HicB family nuclease